MHLVVSVHVHVFLERSEYKGILDVQLADRQSMQCTDSTEHAEGGVLHHRCKSLEKVYSLTLSAPIDDKTSLEADNLSVILLLFENKTMATQDGSATRWVWNKFLAPSLVLERVEI
jgi:hypothetical protein